MRPWTVPFFALALLLCAPALAGDAPAAGHAAEADQGHQAKADHASPAKGEAQHAEAGHGESVRAPFKPANPERVGLTAVLVMLVIGGGVGLIPILKEQLS
jgi:hypothetical protein